MKKENMYVPSGLKTRDGKDIMCYTAEFYVKNKAKIDRIIKKCEEILCEDSWRWNRKIKNAKGEDEIMTNASRIINNEMRKQRKAGIEEGKAEGRAIGRIAGIKENQEKVIRRLKLMNLSTQQIAKAVELEIKEVEKILNEKQ